MTKPEIEILYNLYVDKCMTTHEIGDIYDCTNKTICRWLKEYNIPNRKSPFSKEELSIIKDYYEQFIDDKFDLNELSLKLGRPQTSVCRQANKMEITNSNRKNYHTKSKLDFVDILFLIDNHKNMSYKELNTHLHIHEDTIRKYLKKLSIYTNKNIGKWDRSMHPKGMLGKNHTDDVCTIMSRNLKDRWNDPTDIFNSDEYRQKKSDYLTEYHRTHIIDNPYSRCHGGKRDDLDDQYFRSSWEANFARYLNYLRNNGDIFRWEYEPDRFEFIENRRGIRSYTPDFKIWETENSLPYYYEVKGWMDSNSKIKIELFKEYYSKMELIIITEKEYRVIRNSYHNLVEWEDYDL